MGEAKVKQVERNPRTFWERTYVPEIAKGLAVTIGNFLGNLSPKKEDRTTFTVQYPEQTRDRFDGTPGYPERYRGLHRLMLRDDGQVRCVACMCCSTICPANCIHIEAAEHDDPEIEKYPRIFVIDELRCIVCGLCVEACPCDAIRMDSGVHIPVFGERGQAFLSRDLLMERGTLSVAKQGGERG